MRDRVFRDDRRAGCCRPCRRSTPSSRCWPIRSSSTAGSAPTPISSTCSICAGSRCRRRCAPDGAPFGHHAAGAGRTRCRAGVDRPRVPCRYRLAARRDRTRAAAARAVASSALRAGEIAARGRRRASLRHAAQWRIADARCARFIEETTTTADYRLLRARGRRRRRSPGMLRVGDGEGAAIAVEVWALTAEAFGHFVAAVPPPLSIGTRAARRRPRRKGFLVEATAVERRARHLELRRLARVYGREGLGYSCSLQASARSSTPRCISGKKIRRTGPGSRVPGAIAGTIHYRARAADDGRGRRRPRRHRAAEHERP